MSLLLFLLAVPALLIGALFLTLHLGEGSLATSVAEKKRNPKMPIVPKWTSPPTLISVINASSRVTDAEVAKMTAAIGKQLALHVSPIWGQVPALEFVPKGGAANGIPCTISDIPDVPGAAGYHDEDTNGMAYIKVFTFADAPNLVGPNALSVTLSHEILEVIGDSPANKWADGPDGSDYAYELCDAVEGDTYAIDGVSVSNFLYPAFFDPRAARGSKLDYLSKVTKPFAMSPGGYQIKRTEPGATSQIFARATIDGHDLRMLDTSAGIYIVFGSDFPNSKKYAKIHKASRRRCPSYGADCR